MYSIFYVHDSSTGRWTSSDWVISYGGAGRQPSYLWTASGWVQIGHGGLTFKANPRLERRVGLRRRLLHQPAAPLVSASPSPG